MILTEQKQKEYLKTLNFGIKDFYVTSKKYFKYKDSEFKQFLKDNKDLIKDFLEDLNQDIFNNIINDYKNYMRIENLNFKKKMDIRHFKTYINNITQEINLRFIENNFNRNLNQNEKRNFNIKFYLYFYDKINQEMKISLNEIVEHQTDFN